MLKKILILFLFFPSLVLAADFIEGKDYQLLPTDQKAGYPQIPAVTEFFSYACPWCYRLEKPIQEWVKKLGKDVQFERIPVVFKPDWELYAKAYYTAKVLALPDEVNDKLFQAIQVDKTPITTKQAMVDFFVRQGVDKEIAQSAFEHSPSIDLRVQEGMALMAKYQVNGVPAFIINHKYKTDLQKAGNPERLVQILDYLIRLKN